MEFTFEIHHLATGGESNRSSIELCHIPGAASEFSVVLRETGAETIAVVPTSSIPGRPGNSEVIRLQRSPDDTGHQPMNSSIA
jgi:hypothetical protein